MRKWLISLLALVAVVALLAVGCGGDNQGQEVSASPSATGGEQELTAQQIVDNSQAAMAGLKSASFGLDLSAAVQGDTAKMTDEQLKAMAQSPITVTGQGKVSNEPQKADMTISANFAGQAIDVGLRMDGDSIWVQFMDTWYVVPKDMLSSMTGASPAPSASPSALTQQLMDQIKGLGVDPSAWSQELTLVGEETVDGVDTYHISQTLDIDKMAADLVKVMGSVSSLTGSTDVPDTQETEEAVTMIKESLKDLTLDYWYAKDTFYLSKIVAGADLDFTAQADAQAEGVDSMSFDFTMGMSDFDQDVAVEAPADAQPFEQLMNALMSSGALDSL